MIHLGAMVGRMVSAHDSVVASLAKRSKVIDALFRNLRNEKDARDFVTAGTAAGVASAFGAPVGGVLFALEEISSSWTPSLTWKVFLTSMLAASVTCVIISAHTSAEDKYTFIGTINRESIEFYQGETSANNVLVLIPAIFIGLVAGVLAAGFTSMNLKFIALRKRFIVKSPTRRILEPIFVMSCVVLLTVGLSEAMGCTPVSGRPTPSPSTNSSVSTARRAPTTRRRLYSTRQAAKSSSCSGHATMRMVSAATRLARPLFSFSCLFTCPWRAGSPARSFQRASLFPSF